MKTLLVTLACVLSLGTAVATVGCSKTSSADDRATQTKTGGGHEVTVDGKGFTPSSIEFKKGEKGAITFTRTSDDTCAKEVVFPEINLKKDLPLNKPVVVEVPTDTARTLTFTCGMGMFKSAVVIR
jgi:plastocyanin domain-containing protein